MGQDRQDIQHLKFNKDGMERLVRSWKGHKWNGSFSNIREKHKIWMFSQGRAWKWILPFYLESIQKEMFMDERWNITIYIWNKGEKKMLNLIPHESHKSELHLLLIPVKLYNVAQRCSSTLFPYFLSYRLQTFSSF